MIKKKTILDVNFDFVGFSASGRFIYVFIKGELSNIT